MIELLSSKGGVVTMMKEGTEGVLLGDTKACATICDGKEHGVLRNC